MGIISKINKTLQINLTFVSRSYIMTRPFLHATLHISPAIEYVEASGLPCTGIVVMLRLVVFAVCVWSAACLHSLGKTNYDAAWQRDCPPNYYLRRIASTHSNWREDREWEFFCTKSPVRLGAAEYTPSK